MNKIIICLLIATLLTGCAGYKFEEIQTNLETGKPQDAYNLLEKNAPKKPDIPYNFELALTAHYADLFTQSSKAFEQAELLAEERFTKSVSTEALSLITTDQLRPYAGTRYERLLGHYYHALNYIYLKKMDEALVECRRATNLIQYFKGEDDKYDFFSAGLLAHFSGILFEAVGEWNDAFISYRQAEEYYNNSSRITAVPIPNDIGHSLVRLSRKLNFTDEFERYKKQYGESPSLPKNYGELILFYETGYVPRKQEENIVFPILKTDKFGEGDDKDTAKFARTLRSREGMVVEDIKLEYLLRIAMPVIRSKRPRFSDLKVSVDKYNANGVLVGDIEIMAIETHIAKRPIILIRTLVRALGKYLIFRKANKENKIAGALVNLAGVVTESADTRSWQTLPNQIYMVRMPLPEGNHRLKLSFLNRNGQVIRTENIPDVEIKSNRIEILNYRTYE